MPAIIHIQRQASSRVREGRKRLHHIEVHPAKNGGQTVEHHYALDSGMSLHEPDVYAFASGKDALAHLAKQLDGESGPEEEEA